MHNGTDVIFSCDGSFEGVLCCAFASYEFKAIPSAVVVEGEESFFTVIHIQTDLEKAARVKRAIIQRCDFETFALIQDCYYSPFENKDLLVVKFIRLAMLYEKKVTEMLANECVMALYKAARYVRNEAHQYKGFVRFSVYDKVMVAVIEPKSFVLSHLAPHFRDRYPNLPFMIYDKTHGVAFVSTPREFRYIPLESFIAPDANDIELEYQNMWKMYYKTIAIKQRENYTCMRGHMQKRYWKHLTEM